MIKFLKLNESMVRYSVVNQEVEEIVAYGDELIQMLSMAIAMNHLTMFASFLNEDRLSTSCSKLNLKGKICMQHARCRY